MTTLSRLITTTTRHSLRHFLTRSHHSFLGSAAATQPQFDYDTDDSRVLQRVTTPIPVSDTEVSRGGRGVQWVFIGNPDAKKQLYVEMVSKLVNVPYINITTLLRPDLNPLSPLHRQIVEAVNGKKIVPETIIFGLLSERLEDGRYRGETGFILDGIPRTRLQAEILDEFVDIDLVVNFKRSGDHFQTERSTAEDVKPNVITFYREQKRMLEKYYQNQKKLIDFNVGNAPGETWKGLLATLHLQHANAALSSWRLAMGFRVP